MADRATYAVAGPAGASAIVFLHGAAFTRRAWAPQLSALRDDFRVIAVDLPGHGELADVRFTMPGAVREARRIIDREAGGRALVVGASLGGVVGLELAHAHPDRVAGLVLAGATVDYSRPRLRLLTALNAWLLAVVYPHRLLTALQTRALPHLIGPELARVQVHAGFFFRGAAAGFLTIGAVDYLGHLAAFPGPTLFINGSSDGINCRGEEAFVRAARHGRSHRIDGAGHAVNLERPGEFTAAIRAFATSIGWLPPPHPAEQLAPLAPG